LERVGTILFKALAQRAREASIRRWKAIFLTGNTGARKLMELVGTKHSERLEGPGVIEAIYKLFP